MIHPRSAGSTRHRCFFCRSRCQRNHGWSGNRRREHPCLLERLPNDVLDVIRTGHYSQFRSRRRSRRLPNHARSGHWN
jgi:hypothetical protein